MLSDRDRSVVATMCRTGMTLDVLIKSFPQFASCDIEEIYKWERENLEDNSEYGGSISCNCS